MYVEISLDGMNGIQRLWNVNTECLTTDGCIEPEENMEKKCHTTRLQI